MELNCEEEDLNSQLYIAHLEKEIAQAYAPQDVRLFSRNEIIEATLNLDYLNLKSTYYQNKKTKQSIKKVKKNIYNVLNL